MVAGPGTPGNAHGTTARATSQVIAKSIWPAFWMKSVAADSDAPRLAHTNDLARCSAQTRSHQPFSSYHPDGSTDSVMFQSNREK